MLEGLQQLVGRALARSPRERGALDAFGVGVLGRREGAPGQTELAQHVVDRLLDDAPIPLVARAHPSVQVGGDEQRVVVEHLLEVRDEPALVDRVPVEPPADEVVHPPERHAVERPQNRLELVAPQQELEHGRGRELRCAAEAAPDGVDLGAEDANGVLQHARRERLVRRVLLALRANGVDERLRLLRDVAAAFAVGVRHRREHLPERRHPVPRFRRVVRPAEERLAVGRQEHRHRPAAVAAERDDRVHVHGVEVGTFLAVDLDVDEPLVHQLRNRGVLERLVLHHVAPVTGRVADREQDRLVLGARAFTRVVAPGVPVDGVVRVLEEIRAGLLGQAVHVR